MRFAGMVGNIMSQVRSSMIDDSILKRQERFSKLKLALGTGNDSFNIVSDRRSQLYVAKQYV